jgi:hypothetical protein
MLPEPAWVAERGAREGWEELQWLGWETIKARFAEAGAEVRPMDGDGVFLDGQDVPFLAEFINEADAFPLFNALDRLARKLAALTH